ncbi:MAG: hypothetical protein JW915_24190 [Chitinispirillaceae bacterium]|nr:hypothetical protein [Chitinispirillaceae bacterium]
MQCVDCKTKIEDPNTNAGTVEYPRCRQCLHKILNNFNSDTPVGTPEDVVYYRKPFKHTKSLLIAGIVLFFLIVFMGNFHIISSMDHGFQLISRVSFSLNEFFVNLDEITGMPAFEAKKRFPLAIKALVKAKMIESDEAREKRVAGEIANTTKQIYDSIQVEMKKAQIESERQTEEYLKKIRKILDY